MLITYTQKFVYTFIHTYIHTYIDPNYNYHQPGCHAVDWQSIHLTPAGILCRQDLLSAPIAPDRPTRRPVRRAGWQPAPVPFENRSWCTRQTHESRNPSTERSGRMVDCPRRWRGTWHLVRWRRMRRRRLAMQKTIRTVDRFLWTHRLPIIPAGNIPFVGLGWIAVLEI